MELHQATIMELWEAFNKSADATAKKFSDNLKPIPAVTTAAILANICARYLSWAGEMLKNLVKIVILHYSQEPD